jgi:hypothetical protein
VIEEAAPQRPIQRAKALVEAHPLVVTGGALALGVLAGFLRPRGRIGGAFTGAVGGILLGVMRDLAVRKFAGVARHWIDEHERQRAEDVTARNREVESFLEH